MPGLLNMELAQNIQIAQQARKEGYFYFPDRICIYFSDN